MKTNIDFLEFIKTGVFGSLEFGMTKQAILDLGLEPDNWMSEFSKETSPIWRYGTVELYFDLDNIFYQVFTDYLDEIENGKTVSFENHWILSENPSLKKALGALEMLGLNYERNQKYDDSIEVTLDSNVLFSFHPDNEGDNHLDWKMGAIWKNYYND